MSDGGMEGTRAGEMFRAPGTGTPPNQSSGTAPHFCGADLKACGRPFQTQSLGHATATSSQLVSHSHLRAPAQAAGPPVPLDLVGPGSSPRAPQRTRAASGPRPAHSRPQRPPRGARAGPRPPQPRVGHRCPFKKGEGAREGTRRRWPSAALPVRAETSPAGRGQPGDRQAARGRPAHPAEEDGARQHGAVARPGWRAEPPAAHTEGPASLSGKAPGGGAGEGEATAAVTVPGRLARGARVGKAEGEGEPGKGGAKLDFFRLEKMAGSASFFQTWPREGRRLRHLRRQARPSPVPRQAAPEGGSAPPSGTRTPSSAARPCRPRGAWNPARPRARPRRRPHARALPPGEDRAGERLKVCFSTRRPPRGRGGPRAPKS